MYSMYDMGCHGNVKLELSITFYAPEGTSGGILKSNHLSIRLSVTNRVSAIIKKTIKEI